MQEYENGSSGTNIVAFLYFKNGTALNWTDSQASDVCIPQKEEKKKHVLLVWKHMNIFPILVAPWRSLNAFK
jgi:hypothetical protein